nr:hypothetical protein CFP56_59690 [Quercus suber]
MSSALLPSRHLAPSLAPSWSLSMFTGTVQDSSTQVSLNHECNYNAVFPSSRIYTFASTPTASSRVRAMGRDGNGSNVARHNPEPTLGIFSRKLGSWTDEEDEEIDCNPT